MLVRILIREDPDQTASLDNTDNYVGCLCIFGRQLVFNILEHLSTQNISFDNRFCI